jgi:hypothetical protein
MNIDTIFTEKPFFDITKEYATSPTMEDLTEIFCVVFREELPNWKEQVDEDENLKASMRYLFFTDLERAFKQYKYYGPRGAVLSRIFTDNELLAEIAKKSNFTIEVEEEKEEEKKQD